jgi:hypothetical protein
MLHSVDHKNQNILTARRHFKHPANLIGDVMISTRRVHASDGVILTIEAILKGRSES